MWGLLWLGFLDFFWGCFVLCFFCELIDVVVFVFFDFLLILMIFVFLIMVFFIFFEVMDFVCLECYIEDKVLVLMVFWFFFREFGFFIIGLGVLRYGFVVFLVIGFREVIVLLFRFVVFFIRLVFLDGILIFVFFLLLLWWVRMR